MGFVLQRPKDAAGDCRDVGVAWPMSGSEVLRPLDQIPDRLVIELLDNLGTLVVTFVGHRRPRYQSWRSKNHTPVPAGTGGSPSVDIQRAWYTFPPLTVSRRP